MLRLVFVLVLFPLERSQPEVQERIAGCWRLVFDGYGENYRVGDTFVLRPAPPEAASITHASLVVSAGQFDEVDFEVDVKTVARLRGPQPNPWEVGWVVWHYTDPTHFYYLLLKPHGWEVGKADPGEPGNQRFLVTGEARVFPPGEWYSVHVRQRGATIEVGVDGERLTTFTDPQAPYLTGSVGFYTEDAEAAFRPRPGEGCAQ